MWSTPEVSREHSAQGMETGQARMQHPGWGGFLDDLRRECWWGTLTQNLKLRRTQALGRTFYFPPSQLCIIRFYIWNTLKIILPLSLMLPPPSLHSLGAPRIPGFCISLGLLTLPRPLLSGALSQPELGTAPSPHPQRGPPVPTSQPHGH